MDRSIPVNKAPDLPEILEVMRDELPFEQCSFDFETSSLTFFSSQNPSFFTFPSWRHCHCLDLDHDTYGTSRINTAN